MRSAHYNTKKEVDDHPYVRSLFVSSAIDAVMRSLGRSVGRAAKHEK